MTDYTKNSFDYNYAEYETLIDYDDEIFPREGSTNETNIMVSTHYFFDEINLHICQNIILFTKLYSHPSYGIVSTPILGSRYSFYH